MAVATHRHGCCVLQRAVDAATVEQSRLLVSQVCMNALQLMQVHRSVPVPALVARGCGCGCTCGYSCACVVLVLVLVLVLLLVLVLCLYLCLYYCACVVLSGVWMWRFSPRLGSFRRARSE